MTKLKYKVFSIILVLTYLISLNTVINTTESQNLIDDSINYSSFDLFTDFVEYNQSNCKLLNGKYAVMTDFEIKPKTYIPDDDPIPTASFDDLPSQFSWRNYGGDWMTPVKDQGNCGCGWDFSVIGTMEAAINLASGFPDTDIDLSEQYVLSCLSSAGSCWGGWTDDAFEAIINPSVGNGINGVPIESCMPYLANDNIPCDDKCDDWDEYNSPPEADDTLWQLQEWGSYNNLNNLDPNDRDIVKSLLMEKGPLSVSMYASSSFSNYWESHHSPNDWYYDENYWYSNHFVVLVGWVDDPVVTNGGYWIVKNSWGTAWGYGGYFNAAYGGQNIGRTVRWCKTFDWPGSGPGPTNYDIAVFSNFEYVTDDGNNYPHPGDSIQFSDISEGGVSLREWDFDGDDVVDSNQKNPSHIYYEEGEYEVTLTVTSEWGLKNNRTKIIKVLEFWPPKAVINYNTIILHDTLVCSGLDARRSYDRDGGSITGYHWDFGDGSTAEGIITDHTFPQGNRIYNVTLTVTDNDGASDLAVCQVKIDDTIPPETMILHRGYFELEEWYSKTQYIYFTANDWTSVLDTYYRIDSGTWNKYEPTKQEYIPVSSEGQHIVEAYSVDYWQNQENILFDSFYIDKTDPTLNVEVTGGEQINGWYTTPATVVLSGEDTLSGLYKIMYKLDYTAWQTYTGPLYLVEGNNYLCAFAVDNAGNANEECIKQVKVDLSDPKTSCMFIGQGSNNRFYKKVEIRILGLDKGSGIKNMFYNLDNQGFKTYYQPIIVDDLGEHTIEYYSVDNIDNQESTNTETFTISNLNFDIKITSPINGLYLFGIRVLPIQKTILVGTGRVYVSITPFTQEPAIINHVEFLLDNVLQKIVTEYPYIWIIDGKITGEHTIETIAFTDNYESISDEIKAKFLLI